MSAAAKKSAEKARCSKTRPSRFGNQVQCRIGASVVRDGKPYCGTHDPERVAARRKKREAKWSVKRDEAAQRYHRNDVAHRLLGAVEKAQGRNVGDALARDRALVSVCTKALASLKRGPR